MQQVMGAIIGFLVLMALFWIVESLWPEDRQQPRWRRDGLVDTMYWFLGYATRFVASIAAVIAVYITTRLIPHVQAATVARQPGWLQALEIVLLSDLIGYWTHRLFHRTPALWPIHAVHHSSQQVDWLSSGRVHPLDTILHRIVEVVPFFLLGYSGKVLAPFAVFLAIYPIYLHANLAWGYGPLRYVIASPAFHRWHHAAEEAALDKNFSGLFPFYDLLFGTAYFPHRAPQRYGLHDEVMPAGVLRQTLYPFRRRRYRANQSVSPQ